jgi:hypothetical protein
MRFRKGAVLAALTVSMAAPATAQSGWRQIGQAQAGADASSVTIAVHDEGSYREYMICTDGGTARLIEGQLHYRDNRVQTYRIRARVAAGACSRPGTLSGRNRAIASLDLGYDPASLEGARPKLQLYVR